jgi:hypothetical protein
MDALCNGYRDTVQGTDVKDLQASLRDLLADDSEWL